MNINQRADGRWCATWTDERGHRQYVYGQTKAEVERKLRERHKELSVSQLLCEWIEANQGGWTDKTSTSYEGMVRLHLIPQIGDTLVSQLVPDDVRTMVATLQERGFSNRTVEYAGLVLSRALNWGVKWAKVERNVVRLVRLPRVERKRIEPLTPEQARSLLEALKGHRLEVLYRLALALGLRQGELLRLRWRDVDFTRQTLTVQTSKTASGERTLPLPSTLVAALRSHFEQQSEERTTQDWQDNGLVFPSGRGTPMTARNLVRHFKSALHRAGLPEKWFHDLRHSCAAFLIAEGVNMHVVKEILGHSRASFTSDVYGHLVNGVDRTAVEGVERLLAQGES